MSQPMTVPRFFVRQRVTLAVNRYEVLAATPDGQEGPLLAFAQQKRFKLKEEIEFFTGPDRTRRLFSFRARQRLDVAAEHDVFDETGRTLGTFRKVFGASLLRSTWQLSGPGLQATGRERNPTIAVLRRIWNFIPIVGDVPLPFVFHFDFVDDATGAPVLTSERRWSFRDTYDITVPDPRVDFRVAAGIAVALDALQSR